MISVPFQRQEESGTKDSRLYRCVSNNCPNNKYKVCTNSDPSLMNFIELVSIILDLNRDLKVNWIRYLLQKMKCINTIF